MNTQSGSRWMLKLSFVFVIVALLASQALLPALALGAQSVSTVHAPSQTYTVFYIEDDDYCDANGCTLRGALNAANANPGTDTIVFDTNFSYNITVTSTLTINDSVTIDGSGTNVTVSGGNSVQVFNVNSGVIATLDNLIITHGSGVNGGGIYNHGTLTITNSMLIANSSTNAGGALHNADTLTISNSTISGNSSAGSAGDGGGISNGGTLTITNSTISGNSGRLGGGINSLVNSLTIMNSTIYSNTATFGGGGIYNGDGTLTVMNSTIFGNSAGSGGWGGGGIENLGGTLTLTNSTLSGNFVAAGSGGGIYNGSGSTLNYANTLIANSTPGGDCVNSGGNISTNTNNLVMDGSCSASLSGNPLLGTLANNGGSTWTMALLPGSPAIDAGNNVTCAATDQRGVMRPQGMQCDIGAYEKVFYYVYLPLVLR